MLIIMGIVVAISVVAVIDIAIVTLENQKLKIETLERTELIMMDKEE